MATAAGIQFNVDAALAKLGELVATHGPDAVNLAAHVVQIDAINTLTGFPGFGACALFALWGARWSKRRMDENRDSYGNDWAIPMCGSFLISGAFFVASISALLDVWAWVALFNPKLALAHQVLARLSGS